MVCPVERYRRDGSYLDRDLFLFVVAAMNLVILADIWKTFRRVRKDGACAVD